MENSECKIRIAVAIPLARPKHQQDAALVRAAVRTLKGQWTPHSLSLLQKLADSLEGQP